MKKILFALCLSACLGMMIPSAFATVNIDTMRVGLYYDDTRLTSANLANINGSGYRFGYYTNKTTFVPLGQTAETSVTMVIGNNVYLVGTNFSTDSSSGTALGCYHALHSSGYASYDAAKAVASGLSSGFVAWIEGDFQVRSGAFTTSAQASTHANAVGGSNTVVGTSGYSINMVKTGTTELIFQFDGGSSKAFGVEQDITGHSDPQVWFKNIQYRGGFQYQRVSQGNMVVSNVIDLDSYVKGVVPYEMSGSWPLEALKSQAVCARTYGVLQAQAVRHSSENFDICNTACCQVYYGNGGPNINNPTTTSDQAVEETKGMYLWHGNSLAGTYYSSSHGGASESVTNVWGSSLSTYPYLCGVIDPYEQLASSINGRSSWSVTYTKAELTTMLQGKGFGVGSEIASLETVYSATGNAISLIIHWSNGKTNSLTTSEMRYSSWLNLPSIHFIINETLPAVVETGSGGSSGTSARYQINESIDLTTLEGLYTLGVSGISAVLPSQTYVISGSGTVSALTENDLMESTVTTGSLGGAYASNLLSGSRTVTGETFVFNGSGWGHNLGMSQFGAYAMAQYKNFTYIDILEFYFPTTQVKTA